MSRSGRRPPSKPPTLNISPAERVAYVDRQIENAELFLQNAKIVNRQARSGHIAASLLYDCFECLITAAIAHAPDAPIYNPQSANIHNRRRNQVEQLYSGQLPREHYKLSFIIKGRNAIRYIDPGDPLAPWQIREFEQQRIQRHIEKMDRYLMHVKQLLQTPYTPSS